MSAALSYKPRFGATYPSLSERVVVVTGGGSGIGECIVEHFVAQRSKVAFIDVDREISEQLREKIRSNGKEIHFEHVDLKNISALQQAIDKIRAALGPISILINNAANDQRIPLSDITSDSWDAYQAVNLKQQFFCAQAVVGDMADNGNGAIVNMSSIAFLVGSADLISYSTAKAGIVGLTRSLARELGPKGIRVNSVLPGWIMTKRQMELWVTPETEKDVMARQCLKRKLYPDDIARAILFLASDEASGCTNQSYVVDGGWT